MRVNIDGREYVPATDLFRLTDAHFEAAAAQPDSFGLIRWAHETQSSVAEMLAWGRTIPIQNSATKPEQKANKTKVAPLPTGQISKKKPALF